MDTATHRSPESAGATPAGRCGLLTRLVLTRLLRHAGVEAPARKLLVERDIPVPASDGVALLTDHWASTGERSGHVVLMRTPYGRRRSEATARAFASFGHDVVVQSCRGTFGSGGEFVPFLDEAADGRAAFVWLRSQPFYAGSVHTFGASYAGFTQWALAEDPPEGLMALNVAITARRFRDAVVYPGGSFGMETALTWLGSIDAQELPPAARLARTLQILRGASPAADVVPPEAAMRALLGHDVQAFQDWLVHDTPGDAYWRDIDFTRSTERLPRLTLVAGWQDLFVTDQLDDAVRLQSAGCGIRLVVGPWTHMNEHVLAQALQEALVGLGSTPAPSTPARMRIWVSGGADTGWRTVEQWPPPSSALAWHLAGDGFLRPTPPTNDTARRWQHDPVDPAPNAGGRALNPLTAGMRSQRRREARADVVVWTSEPLDSDLLVVGTPQVTLHVGADGPHDLFARLCDVDRRGRSVTVSDALIRLPRPEVAFEPREMRLDLGPTAHRFTAGHRLRLQVSAAAHPLYLRHPGWEAPLGAVERFEVRQVEVSSGPRWRSRIALPVVPSQTCR